MDTFCHRLNVIRISLESVRLFHVPNTSLIIHALLGIHDTSMSSVSLGIIQVRCNLGIHRLQLILLSFIIGFSSILNQENISLIPVCVFFPEILP